jgi:Tol biopolymer transport system component
MVCLPTSYNAVMWSADGSRLYYTIYDGTTGHINLRTMDARGGDDHLLVSDAGFAAPSPDGKWILYQEINLVTGGSAVFSLLDLSTREIHKLGDLGPAPGWSPDGKSILYAPLGASSPITVMDVDTGKTRTVIDPLPDAAYGDGFPQWSPEGDLIAFLSDRDGPVGLYVVAPDGTGLERAEAPDEDTCTTQGFHADNMLAGWSADGKQLAYARICQSTTLNVLALDGKRASWSYSAAYVYPVIWSPEGGRILFVAQTGNANSELIVANADGSDMKTLGSSISQAAWSPDGQRIAYIGWVSSGLIDIYSMAYDGSDVKKLTSNPGVGVICPH